MGTDHRAEAEFHITRAEATDDAGRWETRNWHTAMAQVHATLAAADPVELLRMARREMANKIAVAIGPHCTDCAAVARGLGEQP